MQRSQATPLSDAELYLHQCTAPGCSPPETKLQKSWLWKLHLLQRLYRQQNPSDLQQKQLLPCCVVNHLDACGGGVVLFAGFLWLGVIASPGSARQKGAEAAQTRCLAEVWTSKLQLAYSSRVAKCGGSTGSCRCLCHLRICPKCLITTDHPCFWIFSFTPPALWGLNCY